MDSVSSIAVRYEAILTQSCFDGTPNAERVALLFNAIREAVPHLGVFKRIMEMVFLRIGPQICVCMHY